MDLSPILFRPADGAAEESCDWRGLVAMAVARQAASPTARAHSLLLLRAGRPAGAFAGRVAAMLAAAGGVNGPFTPPFQSMFKPDA